MSIRDNIARIREEIERVKSSCGINRRIYLCAATKTRGIAEIRSAVEAGVDFIGENRIQEAREKYGEFADAGIGRHFIGSLQRNKVKYTFDLFDCIQSVDSAELIESIDLNAVRKDRDMDFMIEVNISGEASKHGVPPDEMDRLIDSAFSCERIRLVGLMAMLPLTDDESLIARDARKMYGLFERYKKLNDGKSVALEYLSMGMSGDYGIAVAEGSNIVRIGTSIFGERSR